MKQMSTILATVVAGIVALTLTPAFAKPPEAQTPSSQEDIKAALSGGVPMGRWKEGLTFEGISPQPWLTSAAILFGLGAETIPQPWSAECAQCSFWMDQHMNKGTKSC